MKKRAIVIVVDSMGCGALPDAKDFNDDLTCNTLANLAEKTGKEHKYMIKYKELLKFLITHRKKAIGI